MASASTTPAGSSRAEHIGLAPYGSPGPQSPTVPLPRFSTLAASRADQEMVGNLARALQEADVEIETIAAEACQAKQYRPHAAVSVCEGVV